MQTFISLLFCIMCFVLCLECLPSGNKYQRQIPTDDALTFMKKYGYLVDDNGQSEAIYSEENLSGIIKTMQRFGAISETGVIDNDTLKLMSSPRCGVPDVHPNRLKRYATVAGWPKRHITYYISNWAPKLGENTVATNIQKALDIWGRYGHLTFTRSSSPNADIIVNFARSYHGDRFPFDGPGLVLAHAFFPIDYVGVTGMDGDIHFDADEDWTDLTNSDSDEEGTDFFTVALHELGHSLGLSHSDVATSVMFPYYKGWDKSSNNVLDYDDILGMYNLYIQRRLKEDDLNPPRTQPETTTRRQIEETTTSWRRRHEHRPRDPPRNDGTVTYEGDDESVEVHIGHDPHRKTPPTNSPSLPMICQGHFDAVATLRGQLFVFKDDYLWRFERQGVILPGYPIPIKQMFPDLPKSVKKIDAAYQRPDGHILLFTGNRYWVYNGVSFVDNSPLPLTYLGLPRYLDSIDAVQHWSKNDKTYFYKKDRFWRYNETAKTMDEGYPMHMERWRGVPSDLDAATTWTDGVTYFFKGDLFWKFDNTWIMPTESSPLPIAPIWLGCDEDPAQIQHMFGS